jgi:hypothetical protein
VIRPTLDRLVAAGRLSGYTLEDDSSYLDERRPTLTYRMYSEGAESLRNLGEFVAALADLGVQPRLSRVTGTVAGAAGGLRRTRQLCVTGTFRRDREVEEALALIQRRFTAGARAAVPGSWRYPDVRVTGSARAGTIGAWAHRWLEAGAVVLSLSPAGPAPGGTVSRVRVLERWLDLLAPAASRQAVGAG